MSNKIVWMILGSLSVGGNFVKAMENNSQAMQKKKSSRTLKIRTRPSSMPPIVSRVSSCPTGTNVIALQSVFSTPQTSFTPTSRSSHSRSKKMKDLRNLFSHNVSVSPSPQLSSSKRRSRSLGGNRKHKVPMSPKILLFQQAYNKKCEEITLPSQSRSFSPSLSSLSNLPSPSMSPRTLWIKPSLTRELTCGSEDKTPKEEGNFFLGDDEFQRKISSSSDCGDTTTSESEPSPSLTPRNHSPLTSSMYSRHHRRLNSVEEQMQKRDHYQQQKAKQLLLLRSHKIIIK